MEKLGSAYYQQDNVVHIAKDLIGKYLFTKIGEDEITGGIIIETEAYRGPDDRGSHAYNNRRTARNETMYAAGGIVYMYICYGIHDMLNIVTGTADNSHAVLIRAIEPKTGLETMRYRRNLYDQDIRLCQGPGSLAKALGLNKSHNGYGLHGDEIWIEDHHIRIEDSEITAAPRVGMNFDGPYKTIPWRFYLKGNKFVSKPNR